MRIDIYSLQKSHSFAVAARFSTKSIRNVSSRVITSLDDISISSAESIDDVGLLCVGANLHQIIDEVKSAKISVPIIAMTEKSDIKEDIALLDDGYDDVIRTHCDVEEIAARFRSIARRATGNSSNKVKHGRLVTFLDGRDPEVDGVRVKLTHIEHTILDAISRRAGSIISREKLFERIYPDGDKQPFDKVLDVHIFNLRSKLKKASGGYSFIETLPQRGYRLID
ncbi:response regulator transcription factor [Mesorhizobium sp. SP-1A]|uniref:response regulator transcription factor n=1 Tax=Mesorhizobium sp. SP-1A TaxID=3077840 RepID=UPI0028F6DCD6|nr:response regulator transcription factor [Mesorhizobium sp. SP-1A]